MARPKLAENLKRDSKYTIYLTPAEDEMVKEFATKQMNLPIALVIRIALLEYIQRHGGDTNGGNR